MTAGTCNEAAAEAIGVQRHALLALFRPAIREQPFVVRRRDG